MVHNELRQSKVFVDPTAPLMVIGPARVVGAVINPTRIAVPELVKVEIALVIVMKLVGKSALVAKGVPVLSTLGVARIHCEVGTVGSSKEIVPVPKALSLL